MPRSASSKLYVVYPHVMFYPEVARVFDSAGFLKPLGVPETEHFGEVWTATDATL
jgi:hypothetical protein